MKATQKQVNYINALLGRLGMSEQYLGSWCKAYALTQRERRGRSPTCH